MKKTFKTINIFTVLTFVIVIAMGARMSTLVDGFKNENSLNVVTRAAAVESVLDQPPANPPEQARQTVSTASEENRIQQERGLPDFPVMNFSETELEVLQSLSERRRTLEEMERTLRQREALLEAAEQEVDRKISELAQLRLELEGLLGKQEKAQEERLASMVRIYEGMKPKEAAAIFNTLDMDVLLAVISRMNERRSAPILASMNPERTREVTINLVEQSQLPELNLPNR